MAIQIGGTTVIDNSRNINAGIGTFTRLDVPPVPITFSPAIGATGVEFASNIVLTFNQLITKGTGNITLRSNSAGGTAFSTIAVGNGAVTVSGGVVTINPPTDIGIGVTTFVVVDAGAFSGITTTSKNALIDTYSFRTLVLNLGDSYEGGFLICMAAPVRWVISTRSAEVGRSWYCRNDANTIAQQVSGCTGWFVPTHPQLQNPGYCCRSFWGPSPCYSTTQYWSSTQCCGEFADGNAADVSFGPYNACSKPAAHCVRSFRCITY